MTIKGRTGRIAAAAFFLLLPVLVFPESVPGEILCSGRYRGHLQGIARDDDGALYWSFTTTLAKTTADGALLAKVDVPSHHGDLSWADGRIYVAVNLGAFNREPGHADSWIYVYDAGDLALIERHAIPEVVHGAGGIEVHDGRFFVVGGLPPGYEENFVYEWDGDFRYVGRHVLKSGGTKMGIQTVCFARGTWWFGCYGDPPVVLRADPEFRLIGRQEFDAAMGIVALPEGGFLVGRDSGGAEHRGRALPARMDDDGKLILQ